MKDAISVVWWFMLLGFIAVKCWGSLLRSLVVVVAASHSHALDLARGQILRPLTIDDNLPAGIASAGIPFGVSP